MCERDYNTIIAVLYLSALSHLFLSKGQSLHFLVRIWEKEYKIHFRGRLFTDCGVKESLATRGSSWRVSNIFDDTVVPRFHLVSLLLRRGDDDFDGDECIRFGRFFNSIILKRRHQEAMFQRHARL